MLASAEVYPLNDGGILLRFDGDARRLEIEIDGDGDATSISGGEIVEPDALARWFGVEI